MKVSSLLPLPLLLFGVACEQHPLPKQENQQPTAASAPAQPKPADKPVEQGAPNKEEKKEAPGAPKFFDGGAPK